MKWHDKVLQKKFGLERLKWTVKERKGANV